MHFVVYGVSLSNSTILVFPGYVSWLTQNIPRTCKHIKGIDQFRAHINYKSSDRSFPDLYLSDQLRA